MSDIVSQMSSIVQYSMVKNILISTFSFRSKGKRSAINGMVEPLLDFFLKKTTNLTLIDGAHPGSDTVFTYTEEYNNKKLIKSGKTFSSFLISPILGLQNTNSTHILFKIRDLLDVLEIGLRGKGKYDLFIGLESIYTLAGILLRKIGKVKTVVYYVSDYSPNRYKVKPINSIYLWLDRFCCYNANYIWDVSPVMMPARIKAGLRKENCSPVISVPNALFDKQISYLPKKELQPDSLVYVGTLGPENGPQVAIDAMPLILKKIPKAYLHIIGGDDDFEQSLKDRVRNLKVEDHVIFHGFISNAVYVSRLAQKLMIGLAPYTELPDSPRWFADATKIRLYMGIGLPVITTNVPPLGKDVSDKGAAILVKDDKEKLAEAAVRVLKNPKLYTNMRKAAIAYAKNNTWKNSYSNALSQMDL